MIQQLKLEFWPVHQVAIPMVLSAISVPMLGIVDTAIMGHLESELYLGAVNIGSTALNMLLWALGFLRMSTTGLVAQSHGAQLHQKSAEELLRALMIAMMLGSALLALHHVLIPLQLLMLSDGGLVAVHAAEYMEIRYFALPFSLLLFVINGYFLAINQARKVLALMWLSQLNNIVLDYILVIHFDMDIRGVAWGSFFSEMMALILGIFWLLKTSKLRKNHWHSLSKVHRSSWIQFFKMNSDIFIRTLCLIMVFVLMTRQSAYQGDLILAANAVLMNFFYLTTYGLDGYAHAIESICGRRMGQRDAEGVRSGFASSMVYAMFLALVFSTIFLFWGHGIINLLTDLESVRDLAHQYMWWLVLLPIVAMPSFIYDGFCIGTTQTKVMRNAMLIAVLLVLIPLWLGLKTQFPQMINHMLWLSFLAFFVARGLSMMWLNKPIEDLVK